MIHCQLGSHVTSVETLGMANFTATVTFLPLTVENQKEQGEDRIVFTSASPGLPHLCANKQNPDSTHRTDSICDDYLRV